MGYYVNPPDETKEQFLEREGITAPSSWKPDWKSVPRESLPVVLIDNGPFTAAGIAYSEAELKELTRMDDHRSKKIFFVNIRKLLRVAPDLANRVK